MIEMTGARRGAILLLSLDEDSAAEIFKFLGAKEVQEISMEMARLDQVSHEEMSQVLAEFHDEAEQFTAVNLHSSEHIRSVLTKALGSDRVDLVLSDMAPNLTGIMVADQAGVMQLAELALDLCASVLDAEGDLFIKVFQGEGFDEMLVDMRKRFRRVAVRKPKASRDASREMYLLGQGWRT